jgi:hypothetical protein
MNSLSVDGPRLPICSGLDSECINNSAQTHLLLIKISCENKKPFSFSAAFRVLPTTPFDLIIGLETIKLFNLALLLPSHFFANDIVPCMLRTTHPCLSKPKLGGQLAVRRTTEVKHTTRKLVLSAKIRYVGVRLARLSFRYSSQTEL